MSPQVVSAPRVNIDNSIDASCCIGPDPFWFFDTDTIEINVFLISDNVSFNARVNADARCE